MEETTDGIEEAARIVEAYAEGESEERILALRSDIARDIRAKLLND